MKLLDYLRNLLPGRTRQRQEELEESPNNSSDEQEFLRLGLVFKAHPADGEFLELEIEVQDFDLAGQYIVDTFIDLHETKSFKDLYRLGLAELSNLYPEHTQDITDIHIAIAKSLYEDAFNPIVRPSEVFKRQLGEGYEE